MDRLLSPQTLEPSLRIRAQARTFYKATLRAHVKLMGNGVELHQHVKVRTFCHVCKFAKASQILLFVVSLEVLIGERN